MLSETWKGLLGALILFVGLVFLGRELIPLNVLGLVVVSWFIYASITIVFFIIFFPNSLKVALQLLQRCCTAADEQYTKLAVGYALAFISYFLAMIYTVFLAEAEFPSVFLALFTIAIFSDATYSFLKRKKSNNFLKAGILLLPLSWLLLSALGMLQNSAIVTGTRLVYIALLAGIAVILYRQLKDMGAVLVVQDFRSFLLAAILLTAAGSFLRILSQANFLQAGFLIEIIRSVMLSASIIYMGESSAYFTSILPPLPRKK